MLAIMDSFPADCGPHSPQEPGFSAPASLAGAYHSIEWRTRYDGLVSIAQVEGKAVAGISGPWSGKFALTWWERPLPARQLELYDSMDEAKREVELWAERMRTGGYSAPASLEARARLRAVPDSAPAPMQAPAMHASLFDRVLTLFPQFARAKSRSSSGETIDRLRRTQTCRETDLSGLHFAADK
ncbi:MAG: hypothetical protein ABIQ70_14170 [Dokdonella sp.]